MHDQFTLEKLYNLILEDAISTKAQALNGFVRKEVGDQIFKYKNKPENKEIITAAKEKWSKVVDKLSEIVSNYNPKDKNLIDVLGLSNLYTPNIPFDVIEKDYRDYSKNESLITKKLLHNSKSYQDFAEVVHSQTETKETKKNIGTSNDPNRVYEDENIIVFLANTGDPLTSENNCKYYGKGSSLCISGSSSAHYYNYYRWEKGLTTYFVWLKSEKRYILVDADNEGGFAYNNVKNNDDIEASKEEIIKKYPVLQKAFDNNIFVSVPIEGKEKEIYEYIYHITSILDADTIEDKVLYATIKEVSNEDLFNLTPDFLEPVLKVLVEKEKDLPYDLLDQFPTLKNRYWIKRKQNVERELEEWDNDDEIFFTVDEWVILVDLLSKEQIVEFLEDADIEVGKCAAALVIKSDWEKLQFILKRFPYHNRSVLQHIFNKNKNIEMSKILKVFQYLKNNTEKPEFLYGRFLRLCLWDDTTIPPLYWKMLMDDLRISDNDIDGKLDNNFILSEILEILENDKIVDKIPKELYRFLLPHDELYERFMMHSYIDSGLYRLYDIDEIFDNIDDLLRFPDRLYSYILTLLFTNRKEPSDKILDKFLHKAHSSYIFRVIEAMIEIDVELPDDYIKYVVQTEDLSILYNTYRLLFKHKREIPEPIEKAYNKIFNKEKDIQESFKTFFYRNF